MRHLGFFQKLFFYESLLLSCNTTYRRKFWKIITFVFFYSKFLFWPPSWIPPPFWIFLPRFQIYRLFQPKIHKKPHHVPIIAPTYSARDFFFDISHYTTWRSFDFPLQNTGLADRSVLQIQHLLKKILRSLSFSFLFT